MACGQCFQLHQLAENAFLERDRERRDHATTCDNYRKEIDRLQNKVAEFQNESVLGRTRLACAIADFVHDRAHNDMVAVPALMGFLGRIANNGLPTATEPQKRKQRSEEEASEEEAPSKRVQSFVYTPPYQCNSRKRSREAMDEDDRYVRQHLVAAN